MNQLGQWLEKEEAWVLTYPLDQESIVWFVDEEGVFAGQGLMDPELFMTHEEYEKVEMSEGLKCNYSPFLPDAKWQLLRWNYAEGQLESTPMFNHLPSELQTLLQDAWEQLA